MDILISYRCPALTLAVALICGPAPTSQSSAPGTM